MRKHLFAVLLLVCAICFRTFAALSPIYEFHENHDRDGTGIFYMGRETAQVMGHQGADWLERPEREEEENTEAMVDALHLKPGQVVADIGAGTGYISRKLAKRVGPNGVVDAVEIQKEMLDILTNKAAAVGIFNIKPVLGTITDPKLGSEAVDLVLMVDVYHEFDHPYEMLMAISKALKPGGRVAFVEYRAEDPNVPIKRLHKMSVEQVKKEASAFPLVLQETIETLPRQHIIIFQKAPNVFATEKGLPSLEEALASNSDIWGDAAIKQPNGPSYEFFRELLPPLRYCNTLFKHYPIALSAPGATNKARFVSNGSAVNARAGLKHIWHEVGTPVTFRVGSTNEIFGNDLQRLDGPRYDKGYRPIVQLSYTNNGTVYAEEAFCSTDRLFAEHALIFVRFRIEDGRNGTVSAHVGEDGTPLTFDQTAVRDTRGYALVYASPKWNWDTNQHALTCTLSRNETAYLAIATQPMAQPVRLFSSYSYDQQRRECASTWDSFLASGAQIRVPEDYVNNAWRSLMIGNEMLRVGDAPNYSAGNAYARLYEAECSDVMRAAALFGQLRDARRMIVPCLDYAQKGLLFHEAGFKLQMLAHYYWLSRDAALIREMQPRWIKEADKIINSREPASGLLPKEHYAGDIAEDVYTLNSNANCSKGLRDMAAVLSDLGETSEAMRLQKAGDELRKATLAAVEKSVFTNTIPPFIPIALFGYEKPYEKITQSKLGSYWNLMTPYVLSSDVFGLNSARETDLIHYIQEHGGVSMGLIRFDQHSGLYANENGVDDLYTLRYTDKLLQRDQVDQALVSFYGKLAQALTRDTFISGEGSSFRSLDAFGRPMYLPPNASANAFFLWTLRGLLIQDIDSNDDCRPDTLRLLFATPKQWLEDGKEIRVEHAPTAFGEVSFHILSQLKHGQVVAHVDFPQRNRPQKTLLRIRLPDGWKITSAQASSELDVDPNGTVDISDLRSSKTIYFHVGKL